MRTNHGGVIQWVAGFDGGYPLQGTFHELIINRLMHQRPRGTGTNLARIKREHGETFQRLIEIIIIFGEHVVEENIRRFTTQFQGDRNQVGGGVLHDQPAGAGLAGEGDFGDP